MPSQNNNYAAIFYNSLDAERNSKMVYSEKYFLNTYLNVISIQIS